MTDTPSETAGDGHRDAATGRWLPGNKGAVGHTKTQARLRRELTAAVDEHLPELVARLAARAKDGDTAAAALLLAHAIGKPRQADTDTDAAPLELRFGTLSECADTAARIATAVAAGELGQEHGDALAQLVGICASARKAAVLDDTLQRVEALERARAQGKHR